MKKIYFSLLSLVSLTSVNAQLTQANHAPAAGDKYEVYHCDSVNITPGNAGAGTVWDFSGVTTYSNLVATYSALAVSNPSYAAANVGVATSVNNTSYLNSSSGSLLYYGGNIGIGQILATLNYSAPAVYASYPMSLNTTSSSAIGGTINASSPIPANGTFTGNSTVIADGTGTVIAGGVTHTNTMRVVTTQTISFTTNFASGVVVQKNYDYYSSGIKAPVFSIVTATATVLGSPTTQTMVTRLKSAPPTNTGSTVGIADNAVSSNETLVFPNPASTEVSFMSLNSSATSISVYDITGKLIESKTLNAGSTKFDVTSYNKGLYIYRVTNGNNESISTGKITVIH